MNQKENNINPNLLTNWKPEAVSNFSQLFENENLKARQQAKEHEVETEELYKQIDKLTTQAEWLKKSSL